MIETGAETGVVANCCCGTDLLRSVEKIEEKKIQTKNLSDKKIKERGLITILNMCIISVHFFISAISHFPFSGLLHILVISTVNFG